MEGPFSFDHQDLGTLSGPGKSGCLGSDLIEIHTLIAMSGNADSDQKMAVFLQSLILLQVLIRFHLMEKVEFSTSRGSTLNNIMMIDINRHGALCLSLLDTVIKCTVQEMEMSFLVRVDAKAPCCCLYFPFALSYYCISTVL